MLITNDIANINQLCTFIQLGAMLPQLCHLNLSYCDLRDTGLSMFAPALPQLKQLKELILAGNMFGCDGMESLTRSVTDTLLLVQCGMCLCLTTLCCCHGWMM